MTREREAELIRHVLAGETEAFEEIVLEYQRGVYNLALRMTGSEEDALDLSQEAFFRAFKTLKSFRGDSKFSVWLYRLTSNLCIDRLRRRGRRPEQSLTVEDESGATAQLDIPDTRFSPEAEAERRELISAVRAAVDSLPPELGSVLALREFEGLSYEDISAALSIETGTVKSRLFRARRRVADFLRRSGNICDSDSSNKQKGGR